MSFDWKSETKEKYYCAAESIIKAAGFDDLLKVDKRSFGITAAGEVKIDVIPLRRDGNTRRWWEAKRKIENLHEQKPTKDSYGRTERTILIHGHLVLDMEEQDI